MKKYIVLLISVLLIFTLACTPKKASPTASAKPAVTKPAKKIMLESDKTEQHRAVSAADRILGTWEIVKENDSVEGLGVGTRYVFSPDHKLSVSSGAVATTYAVDSTGPDSLEVRFMRGGEVNTEFPPMYIKYAITGKTMIYQNCTDTGMVL